MRKILPFLLLLFQACAHPVGDRHDLLAIVASAPRIDYAESNLLIDSTGRFFYYQQPYQGFHLDDEEYESPVFINLLPSAVVRVVQHELVDFLKLNITPRDSSDLYRGRRLAILAIGLEKDSIRNPIFPALKAFCAEEHIGLGIRRFTEEETVVLKYKQSGMNYYPSEISWDSSKIHFSVTVPDGKFVPPKVGY